MLCVPELSITKEFEISHAERILRMPNNGGWRLSDDSRYQFDTLYGIRPISDKERDNGAEKKRRNK